MNQEQFESAPAGSESIIRTTTLIVESNDEIIRTKKEEHSIYAAKMWEEMEQQQRRIQVETSVKHTRDIKCKDNEIAQLNIELQDMRLSKMTSQSQVKHLEEKIAQLESRMDSEQQDKILLITELRQSMDRNNQAEIDNKKLGNQIQGLTSKFHQLEDSLSVVKKEKGTVLKQLAEQYLRNKTLSKENKSLNQTILLLNSQIKEIGDNLANATKESLEWQMRFTTIEKFNSELSTKFQLEYKKQHDALQEQLVELNDMRQKYTIIENANSELSVKNQDLTRSLEHCQNLYRSMQSESERKISDLQVHVADLQIKLKYRDGEYMKLRELMASYEESRKQLEATMAKEQVQRRTVHEMQTKYSKQTFDSQAANIKDMTNQFQNSEKQVSELRESLILASQEICDLKKESAISMKIKVLLEQRIEDLKKIYDDQYGQELARVILEMEKSFQMPKFNVILPPIEDMKVEQRRIEIEVKSKGIHFACK